MTEADSIDGNGLPCIFGRAEKDGLRSVLGAVVLHRDRW